MVGATVALRQSSGRSAVVDRPAARDSRDEPNAAGTLCLGPDGVGPVLPAPPWTEAAPDGPEELRAAESEMMLQRLWFALPQEARTRFGGCFSRMVLKVMQGREGCAGVAEELA